MGRLDSILGRRSEVAAAYQKRLADCEDLVLPELNIHYGKISWFVYVVRLSETFDRSDRDWIVNNLQSRGIGCARYFAPIHQQPAYQNGTAGRRVLPVTEQVALRTIALPFFNRITESQIDEVSETLLELVKRRKEEPGR
jgi:perosamine synthetase